ncbi:MAG: hypothetical protein S4CHLAM102_07880 [Chlamydiia bacterium]|nr:hypothetical protein [Chlamydiia bacterium]
MAQTIGRLPPCLNQFNSLQETACVFKQKGGDQALYICLVAQQWISSLAFAHTLFFRPPSPVALISGAGIAGLAASFELRARGYNVVICEKRTEFSRFNMINLSIEVQEFFNRFGLLKRFEAEVAGRITEHRYVLTKPDQSHQRLALSDVRGLNYDPTTSFEPGDFHKLFDHDGVYSVKIHELQTFLAKCALDIGVNILGKTELQILSRTSNRGIGKVQLTADRTLAPDLVFLAEGAHSSTALELGMASHEVQNICTGEKWVFGNATYPGSETFVVSMTNTAKKSLELANVIFNGHCGVVNIAVTTHENPNENRMGEIVIETLNRALTQDAFPLPKMEVSLQTTIKAPVEIINRTRVPFSAGNVYCLGDTAGCSSPLAGMGGTLGLTLVPRTVCKLLDDLDANPAESHANFNRFSKAYTERWRDKAARIKTFNLGLYAKQRTPSAFA